MKEVAAPLAWFALLLTLTLLLIRLTGCAPPYDRELIIVGYQPASTQAQRDSLLQRAGLERIEQQSLIGADLCRLPKGTNKQYLDSLRAAPIVEYLERNEEGKVQSTPSDSLFSQQWYLPRIQADVAWEVVRADTSIIIAFIDAGVDTNHTDLRSQLWLNPKEICGDDLDNDANGLKDDCRGWNFAAGFFGSSDVGDATSGGAAGHGTHVAGLAGATTENQQGISSVSYRPTLLPIRVFTSNSTGGTVTQVANAITYATNAGAHVISISIQLAGKSITVERALRYAYSKGVLVVAAAGNSNQSLDTNPVYPACHDIPNVISVGASDSTDVRSRFSNYGARNVDLFAPGGWNRARRGILSTKNGGGYEYRVGTSQATPIVASAAAQLYFQLKKANQLTRTASDADRVKKALLTSVDRPVALTGLCVTNGRLNVDHAVRSVP